MPRDATSEAIHVDPVDRRRRADRRLREPEAFEEGDVGRAELLRPELRRIRRVRVDERDAVAGARQDRRGRGTAEPGPYHDDVHGEARLRPETRAPRRVAVGGRHRFGEWRRS